MTSARRVDRVVRAVLTVAVLVAALAACTEHEGATEPRSGKPTKSQLDEARRLVNPDNSPGRLTDSEVDCVARTIVMNPDMDQIANDMAQIENKDLREVVMIDYLTCAYNFVL